MYGRAKPQTAQSVATGERSRRPEPGVPEAGSLLLHPASLASLALLVLNDHVLKATWPGPFTGKLSDVAGMLFFPVLLVSAWEIAVNLSGRWTGPSMRVLVVAVISATATFTLVKTLPFAAQLAGEVLGIVQWVFALPIGLIAGRPLSPIVSARVIVDPTDLVAVPAAGLALWIGAARVRQAAATGVVPGRLRSAR